MALLDYSRVGRMPVVVERVDMGELIASVVAAIDFPPAMNKQIEIASDVEPFDTGKAALERLICHLVSNAVVHHDRDDGKVTVAVKRRSEHLEVAVIDDGPGIPAKHHGKVFDLFQTLRRRDETGGCGMGLSLAKKSVESVGGHIELSSDGRGATLRFRWPLVWPEPEA
jgi:hypothetical protein